MCYSFCIKVQDVPVMWEKHYISKSVQSLGKDYVEKSKNQKPNRTHIIVFPSLYLEGLQIMILFQDPRHLFAVNLNHE